MYFGVTQTPETMAWYMLCASKLFPTAGSPSCTHTVLIGIIGMYAFESRIHKVIIEPSDIVEWLAGNQLSTINFCTSNILTDGTANTTFS